MKRENPDSAHPGSIGVSRDEILKIYILTLLLESFHGFFHNHILSLCGDFSFGQVQQRLFFIYNPDKYSL